MATIHFLDSFLMVLGIILKRRCLFLPWMGSQVVFIIMSLGLFLSWTFFSMFVEFLAAFIFPPISALILGILLCNLILIQKVFKRMRRERKETERYPPKIVVYGEEIASTARPHTKLLVSMNGTNFG